MGWDGVFACDLCENKGWVLTFDMRISKWTIEKCDTCDIFLDDEAAGDSVAREELA